MEVIEERPSKKGLILSIIGMALSIFGLIWAIIALCFGAMMFNVELLMAENVYVGAAAGFAVSIVAMVYGMIGGGCGLAGLILGSLGKKTCKKVFPKLAIGFGIADVVLFVLAMVVAVVAAAVTGTCCY